MLVYMIATMMGREIQVAEPDAEAKAPPVGKKPSRYDEAESKYVRQVVEPMVLAIEDVINKLPSGTGAVTFGPPTAQSVDDCAAFKEFYGEHKAELDRRMKFQAELDDNTKGLVDVMLNSANIQEYVRANSVKITMDEIKNCLLQFTKLYQASQPEMFTNPSKLNTAGELLKIYQRWISAQQDAKPRKTKNADGSESDVDSAPALALVNRFMDSTECQNWQRAQQDMINGEVAGAAQRAQNDLNKKKWCSDGVEQLIQKLNSTHTGGLLTEYMNKVYQQDQKKKKYQNTARQKTEELKAQGKTGKELTDAIQRIWRDWENQNMAVTPIDKVGTIDEIADMLSDSRTGFGGTNDTLAGAKYDNKLANRRIRLFQDACLPQFVQGPGLGKAPDVVFDNNWMCMLTYTQRQEAVFGRNKPKAVVQNGTVIRDQIDESINKYTKADYDGFEDVLTPQQVSRRDGDSQHVQYPGDPYSNKRSESGWCTATPHYGSGPESTPWKHTGPRWGRYGQVHLIMMRARDGKMFQYATGGDDGGGFLDEGDRNDSEERANGVFLGGSDVNSYLMKTIKAAGLVNTFSINGFYKKVVSSTTQGTNIRRLISDDMWKNANAQANLKADLLDQGIKDGKITPNGGLVISKFEDLAEFSDVMTNISEIIVKDDSAAVGLFANKEVPALPPVNCQNLTTMESMFEDSLIAGSLTFKNTGRVKYMQKMLKNAMFAPSKDRYITGLDTSSVVNLSEAFYGCRQNRFNMCIQFADCKFDLGRCQYMDRAFMKATAKVIPIDPATTGHVVSAKDAYSFNPWLMSFPTTSFQRIRDGHGLCDDFDGNYEDVFEGCTKLIANQDRFRREIEQMRRFYEEKQPEQPKTDGRGFIILENRQQAQEYQNTFSTAPGVVVSKDADSVGLFNDLKGLRLNVLDLDGVADASYMFQNCRIRKIGSIINTKKLRRADSMFYKCEFMCDPPVFDLSESTCALTIYCDSIPT